MIKKITVLLILTLPVFANIAIVKTLKGSVKIKRNYTFLDIKTGDSLQEDDIIITEENSSIGIIFNDGTRLSLGSKSYICLEKYVYEPLKNNFAFDLNMTKGKALFESGKFGKKAPQAVKFNVPKGIIGIDGTKFYVDIQ